MEALLDTFPCIDAGWAILLWLAVPVVVFLVLLFITSEEHEHEPLTTVVWTAYKGYACSIALWSCVWMFVILLNQTSYIYKNVNFVDDDLGYYFRVDLPAYKTMQAIGTAKATTSSSAVTLSQPNSNEVLDVIYSTGNGEEWGNVLTESNLQAACRAEQALLLTFPCLINSASYMSALTSIFYPASNCTYALPFEAALDLFAQQKFAPFVQDDIDSNAPTSAVLISFFFNSSCTNEYSSENFGNVLNAAITQDQDSLRAVFYSSSFAAEEVRVYWQDGLFFSLLGCGLALLVVCVVCRGGVTALFAAGCVLFSLVCSVALLPLWGYGSYSVVSLVGVSVAAGVSGLILCLYASTYWRLHLGNGEKPTVAVLNEAHAAVKRLLLIVALIGAGVWLLCAVFPVVFLGQIGLLTGVAISVFYVSFYFVLLPWWLFGTRFPLPRKWHEQLFVPAFESWLFDFWFLGELADDTMWAAAAVVSPQRRISSRSRDSARFSADSQDSSFMPIVSTDGVRYITRPSFFRSSRSRDAFSRSRDASSRSRDGGGDSPRRIETRTAKPRRLEARQVGIRPEVYDEQSTSDGDKAVTAESRYRSLDSTDDQTTVIVPVREPTTNRATILGSLDTGYNMGRGLAELQSTIPFPPDESTEAEPDEDWERRQKLFASWVRVAMLLLSLSLLGGSLYYMFSSRSRLGGMAMFRMPQQFPPLSNLGVVERVLVNRKPGLLTLRPYYYESEALPSASPTVFPTVQPSTVEEASAKEVQSGPHPPQSSLLVSGCWGVIVEQQYVDSAGTVSSDAARFLQYADDTIQGLMADLQRLCDYVDANLEHLSVDPRWRRGTYCIFDQLNLTISALLADGLNANVSNALLVWAGSDAVSASLVGVTASLLGSPVAPTWVCANFSVVVNSSSHDNSSSFGQSSLVSSLQSRWDTAFDIGGLYAAASDVPMAASSFAFTYPLLHEQLLGPLLMLFWVVTFFYGLLLLALTQGGVFATLIGTFALLVVATVTAAAELYLFPEPAVDLTDAVFLAVVTATVCASPSIYIIVVYQSVEDERRSRSELEFAYVEEVLTVLSAPWLRASKEVRRLLWGPLFVLLSISIPLTTAKLVVLRKLGRWLFLGAIVSWFYTLNVLPYVLSLSEVFYGGEMATPAHIVEMPALPAQGGNVIASGALTTTFNATPSPASNDNREWETLPVSFASDSLDISASSDSYSAVYGRESVNFTSIPRHGSTLVLNDS